MISPIRIAQLLVNRMTQDDDSHRCETRSYSREQELIDFLLKMINDVCNCTSYQIESETTLDYVDNEEFGDFEDDYTDSADEGVDTGFDDSSEF
ncbi:unnamed protein product [Rotaria magnacalcarata]|uniref:Uncharacterized protein n=1 Tax=Rotaria magnacalcarata TaxID=392030 RepID=A0A816QJY1_9BILA|nr:unnamed protein product [Rotaria magnacalcarata]CAF4314423.1 unnamed protein product [Rotaria magnacalcarata]